MTGEKPCALAEASPFAAAMVDIGLPVMDGYELVGRLKARPQLAGALLVALTGYGQSSDRRRALAAGFHEPLVKPVDLGRLDQILTRLPIRPGNDGT